MPHSLYLRFYWPLVASFVALGLCIVFVQPVYSVPDEFTHWSAAATRVEHLLGHEGCVTILDPVRNRRLHQPLPQYDKLAETPLSCLTGGDNLYGDVFTYPGALIARVFAPRQHESAERQLYGILLTRVFQGLLVLACLLRTGSLARRANLSGALVIAAFALSPLFAQQAFGISSDGAQLCFAISMFAVVAFWERLHWADVLGFLVFGWGATAKPFLLTCVLPSVVAGFWFAALRAGGDPSVRDVLRRLGAALRPTRRPSPQSALLWLGIVLSGATVLMASHSQPVADATVHAPIASLTALPAGPNGADAEAQGTLLLQHPLRVLSVGLNQRPKPWQLRSYAGPLGWLDTPLSSATTRGFVRLFWGAVFVELALAAWVIGPRLRVRARHFRRRLQSVALPLLVGLCGPVFNVFFVALVLYLLWSPVGAEMPKGTQARYYFASVIVAIATIFGALRVLFGPASAAEESTAKLARPSPRMRKALWVMRWAAPIVVLILTVPLVTHVFLDLSKRYH